MDEDEDVPVSGDGRGATARPGRMAAERRLPMAGRGERAVGGPVSEGTGQLGDPAGEPESDPIFFDPVDPERIRAGWEHRFVAAGARAREMIELYGELGFEVAADRVVAEGVVEGCAAACFGDGGEEYRSIYTRRPVRRPEESESVSQTHPTRVLRQEHERILAVADILETLLDEAASDDGSPSARTEAGDGGVGGPDGTSADYDRIGKCIRFIRLFADACHHGKEEDLLFPALQDQGLPRNSGPIAVMLHEHRLGRRFASTMADNVDDARSGDADAWKRLERAGRDYVGLIRGHILKEDNVLFDMADQMVTGPACAMLCQAYDETGDHTFGGCTKAELEELGRELVGE